MWVWNWWEKATKGDNHTETGRDVLLGLEVWTVSYSRLPFYAILINWTWSFFWWCLVYFDITFNRNSCKQTVQTLIRLRHLICVYTVRLGSKNGMQGTNGLSHLSHLLRLWHFWSRKLILQTRMHSHPVGLDVWLLVWPFVYFHCSCVWIAKTLARQGRCAGSPEPSLVAYAISTIISWAGLFYFSDIHICISTVGHMKNDPSS